MWGAVGKERKRKERETTDGEGDHTVGTVGSMFAVGVVSGKAVTDPTCGEIMKSV